MRAMAGRVEGLSSWFSPDRETASREYERLRLRLIRFFSLHRIIRAEDLADEAFNRLARAHPLVEKEISLQDMTASVTQQPFADLAAAIKSRDTAQFAKSYSDLTSACNACHQATNHGIIVIDVPKTASVFDMDLTPPAP